MLEKIILSSIKARGAVVALLAMLFAAGIFAALRLPIDAMPDVTTVQVSVLTRTGGLSAVEAEQAISIPIENALNGIPGQVELRSMADTGVSSVTVIFKEGTDPWFARQLVTERLRGIEKDLPPTAGTPELAPLSTGLGEIYTFVVRSPHHSPMQLRTLLDWEIVPRLRGIPGVTEINTMGGQLKQYQVRVNPSQLATLGIGLTEVVDALRRANQNAGGGYLDRDTESFVIRGEGLLKDEAEIGNVVVRLGPQNVPVRVKDLAAVKVGPALRYGVVTHDGTEEAVAGIVMMLLGANSHDVVKAVGERIAEIRREMPPGVNIDVIYDRAEFVGRTLSTVMTNLAEGVLVVIVVLALFLGTIRGAIAVVLGIPAAMSVAIIGMQVAGVTGDLMSLGAIDFGFLVDGPIVILEAVMAGTAGRRLVSHARAEAYGAVAKDTVRPVAFAVAIIMLVYVPLLTLEGVEGKMFRPMALTMAMALFGALLYAVVFFPAVLVTLVPPRSGHAHGWLERVATAYGRIVPFAIDRRGWLLGGAVGLLVLVGVLFSRLGAEFVPRIFEGDAVVTIRRAPSISLSKALELDLATELVLREFPEVVTTLGMTGRAELAVDIMGPDTTDILVRLRPIKEWTGTLDFDDLSEKFKTAIETRVPGTFVSVSQPIEDRTNELISGSRADVSVQIYGPELSKLSALAHDTRVLLRTIRGTGDVRVERILGQPVINAVANRQRMASYGIRLEDAFAVLSATREGIDAGRIYEGPRRFDLRVIQSPSTPTPKGLNELRVETMTGQSIPLQEVLSITEEDGPATVRRVNRARAVRVDVNLRGRDLLSWVTEAQAVVAAKLPLGSSYRMEWGGQFENFERAQKRLVIVIPIVIGVILGMLLLTFRKVMLAVAVFLTVPLSLTGGMLGLMLRGMPFSLSAAVGFIALGGIAVLNGVIMSQQVTRLVQAGASVRSAVIDGSTAVLPAVLTTTAAAAIGFLPMALSYGTGAEVQRPLATAVAVGITIGAVTTLLVLPGVLMMVLGRRPADAASDAASSPGSSSTA
jgi:cobalt-zinc-cadmium resistance protein CzcA